MEEPSSGSGHKRSGAGRIDTISALAARQRLVFGSVKVAKKSGETKLIPKLLDLLEIERAVIIIDAIGCQREIAQKIIEKKAN